MLNEIKIKLLRIEEILQTYSVGHWFINQDNGDKNTNQPCVYNTREGLIAYIREDIDNGYITVGDAEYYNALWRLLQLENDEL